MLTCISFLFAQDVTFSKFPAHLQLYPRDDQDSSVVEISGKVTSPGYNTIQLDVYKNDQLWKSENQSLVYTDGKAPFDFYPKIHAELTEYQFDILVDGQLKVRLYEFMGVFLKRQEHEGITYSFNVNFLDFFHECSTGFHKAGQGDFQALDGFFKG